MASDGGSVNEQILDLITDRALDLQRLEAGQRRDATTFLRKLEGELAGMVAKSDPTGPARTAFQQKRLDALLNQVRDTIRTAYRSQSRRVVGELRELADDEVKFAASSINKVVGVEMVTTGLTRNGLVALVDGVQIQGAPVSDWWSRQAGDTLQRFTDEMQMGIAQGETNGQLVRRVRGGMRNGEPVNGLMQTSRRHAESLVRSATQAVSQKARAATYEANTDVIGSIGWASTLDGRTTLGCAARDTLTYTVVDHKPIDHDLPWDSGPGQRHWGCRATSYPVTKSWRELGFDIDDIPASTRATMDGQKPADTSFDGWFKRKDASHQDRYLGPGRAKMYRDGNLSMRDLVDGNGRELTLEQLRQRA